MVKSTGCSCKGQDGAHLAGVLVLVLWPGGKKQCPCGISADCPSASQLSSMLSTFRGQGSKDITPGSQRRTWFTSAGLMSCTAIPPTNLCQVQVPLLSLLVPLPYLELPLAPYLLVFSVFSRLPFRALRNRLFLDCSLLYWYIILAHTMLF